MRLVALSLVLSLMPFVPLFSQQGRVPTKPTEVAKQFIPEAAPAGKAVVYLFRVDEPDVPVLPLVFTKQGVLGILHTRSYYRIIVDPGKVTLWFATAVSKDIRLEVEAGMIYYIKVNYKLKFIGGAFPEMEANLLKTTDPTPPKELNGATQSEGPDE